MHEKIILVVEDTPHYAKWQIEALLRTFPDMHIRHVDTLLGAHEILNNPHIEVYAIMTDNGYPLVPDGERCGSKNEEGGAGTLLIKQIRQGAFGEIYQQIPIIWHTARISDDKKNRVLSHENPEYGIFTRCFQKGDGVRPFQKMTAYFHETVH